jgi:hypothetical protein
VQEDYSDISFLIRCIIQQISKENRHKLFFSAIQDSPSIVIPSEIIHSLENPKNNRVIIDTERAEEIIIEPEDLVEIKKLVLKKIHEFSKHEDFIKSPRLRFALETWYEWSDSKKDVKDYVKTQILDDYSLLKILHDFSITQISYSGHGVNIMYSLDIQSLKKFLDNETIEKSLKRFESLSKADFIHPMVYAALCDIFSKIDLEETSQKISRTFTYEEKNGDIIISENKFMNQVFLMPNEAEKCNIKPV